jgi:hypothetical protein
MLNFALAANYVNGTRVILDSNQLTFLDPAVFPPIFVIGFIALSYSSSSTSISVAQSKIQ